ncbi:MAG: metallophosphoesterase [Proteobacteria bacterium]|nr:metallophosphoesterase [Pseudomonadota bacterium]
MAWPIQGAERGSLRIIFYTDVHAKPGGGVPTALKIVADRINARQPDLVLGGGDLVEGDFHSSALDVAPNWDAYMAMHRAIKSEHHVAIGNRDLMGVLPKDGSAPVADPRLIFKRRLGLTTTYQAFDALGYHVMLLDSVHISGDKYKYHGHIAQEQQEWIKAELSRIPHGKPIVLVLHLPLLTAHFGAVRGMTFQAEPNRVVDNNTDVLALFAAHNLVLVLQGHLHVSELLRWGSTTFITGGAVCGRWWRGSYFGTPEGFNGITLRADRVEWEYFDYGWHASGPVRDRRSPP